MLVPPVGDALDETEPQLGERVPDADLDTLAIGVGLPEEADPPVAEGVEAPHQGTRLVAIGRADAEDEPVVRRLALRLGAREGRDVDDPLLLVVPEQREDADERRRSDVAEEEEDVLALDQLLGVADGPVRLVAVVLDDEGDSPAMDAAVCVDPLEVGSGSSEQLMPEEARGPRLDVRDAEDDRGKAGRLSRRASRPLGRAPAGGERDDREEKDQRRVRGSRAHGPTCRASGPLRIGLASPVSGSPTRTGSATRFRPSAFAR